MTIKVPASQAKTGPGPVAETRANSPVDSAAGPSVSPDASPRASRSPSPDFKTSFEPPTPAASPRTTFQKVAVAGGCTLAWVAAVSIYLYLYVKRSKEEEVA